jgi:hypothetical protein
MRMNISPIILASVTLVACTSNKTLPSDSPFDPKEYRAEPAPGTAPVRNAADLVPSPTPSPSPLATPWTPEKPAN